eukprot:2222762-Prymnesium_polylepis.1
MRHNYSSCSSYSRATAELQHIYSSYSRATVTPRTIPPHKELQSQLQPSYSAATVCYSSYSVAPGLCAARARSDATLPADECVGACQPKRQHTPTP